MWNNLWGYVLRGPLHQWTLCRRPIRTWPRSGFGSWSQLSGPIAAVASVPWRSSDDIPGSDSDIWACKENEQLIGYISFYILQYIYICIEPVITHCPHQIVSDTLCFRHPRRRGIYKSVEDVRARVDSKERSWAIQKYIERPLLIHHRTWRGKG
jgi:hypothetical protein